VNDPNIGGLPSKKTIFIGAEGGPSTGKSTLAAAVFSKLKKELSTNSSIEFVQEYAKECIYSDWWSAMEKYQFHVIAEQAFRLMRLNGKVDYVVTDGSLLLNVPYLYGFPYEKTFSAFLLDLESQTEWWHYLLDPPFDFSYEKSNRRKDFEWSLRKHDEIEKYLRKLDVVCAAGSPEILEEKIVSRVLAREVMMHKRDALVLNK